MSGTKGQKSGGYGGRKPLPDKIRRSKNISFRLNEEEKKLIDRARGKRGLREFIIEKALEELKKRGE